MWAKIIGAMVVLVGLCISLDARRLVKKYFNFGEENVATFGMKIFGFTLIIIGGLILLSAKI